VLVELGVRKKGLHPLERQEDGLGASGDHSGDHLGTVVVQAIVLHEVPPRAVEHAEHDGQGDGLLGERREHAAVQEAQSLVAQLGEGRGDGDAVQHLTEYHLVDGISGRDVDEGCSASAGELLPLEGPEESIGENASAPGDL